MATIQVRNVPEQVHRVYQVRAAAAGMSLQEYLLAELIRSASFRSPAEIVAEVDRSWHLEGDEGFSHVSAADIVEVRPTSRELTPFVIARAELADRIVPAWLEVIPGRLRVLVHNLPARQVIDTPVQEQLIVELYSK